MDSETARPKFYENFTVQLSPAIDLVKFRTNLINNFFVYRFLAKGSECNQYEARLGHYYFLNLYIKA